MQEQPNPIEMITIVAHRLGALKDRLVFVGGAVTNLLLTSNPKPKPRATNDVDIIAAVSSRSAFYELEDQLRQIGFVNDKSDRAQICRWIVDGVIVDVMPSDEKILHFSNRWYTAAAANAEVATVAENLSIRIVPATYFLATKLDAFFDRGHNDFMMSRDIEDIISVLESRQEIVEEFAEASSELREYVGQKFADLLSDGEFLYDISAHLLPDAGSQSHREIILDRMRHIVKLADLA